MASLTLVSQQDTASQLPVSWYVDENTYALEQQHLFAHAPHYLGHELMVPNVGDYHVLDWMGQAKSLVHQQDGINVLSNVCRHRQA